MEPDFAFELDQDGSLHLCSRPDQADQADPEAAVIVDRWPECIEINTGGWDGATEDSDRARALEAFEFWNPDGQLEPGKSFEPGKRYIIEVPPRAQGDAPEELRVTVHVGEAKRVQPEAPEMQQMELRIAAGQLLAAEQERNFKFEGGPFDDDIARILKESTCPKPHDLRPDPAGGITAMDWLETVDSDGQRKACLLNILYKLAEIRDYSNAKESLIDVVESVKYYNKNRLHLKLSPCFFEDEKDNCNGTKWKTLKQGLTAKQGLMDAPFKKGCTGDFVAGAHKHLYCTMGLDRETAHESHKLISFRERNRQRYSLQLVFARDMGGDKLFCPWVDVDVDLANPLADLASLIRHWCHIGGPKKCRKKTNHLLQSTYEEVYQQVANCKNGPYYTLVPK